MVRNDSGSIKSIDINRSVLTLDNDQTYKVDDAKTWRLGQRVKVTYEDINGERKVSEVAKA